MSSNEVTCDTCNATFDARQRHACPGFDHEAMAARIDALEAAPRLALRYVARAVAWAHGDPDPKPITLGAFESESAARAALDAMDKAPPNGWSGIYGMSVEPEIVVMFGSVVQIVTLGEVIAGSGK
jgi:hypothetical protein